HLRPYRRPGRPRRRRRPRRQPPRVRASTRRGAVTVVLRRRASLCHAEGGWFSANWHFSLDQYRDEANMGLGDLRVFNDDRLVPGAAWPMHPHRAIEGITYVAEGTFEHADSRGNGGILPPGSG